MRQISENHNPYVAIRPFLLSIITQLQVTPGDIACEPVLAEDQAKAPVHLPLGSRQHNHNHQSHPLQQKNTPLGDASTTSSAGNLIKDAVHSVVDTLFGREDRENVQPRYSRHDIADHCSWDSCWLVINNRVYDVTRFLRMVSCKDQLALYLHSISILLVLDNGQTKSTTSFRAAVTAVPPLELPEKICITRF